SNFDWKAVIEPEEIDQRDCFTDGEEDEILIPFSAPILVGGGAADTTSSNVAANLKFKPRNEINLWKRRTMAPPRPLQLNP
ncbi:syringolide-induced protein 14-1-1, partial [Trifolium medium]|nr:syringolide-induced protein 14-1-1 [Trifolium medium]